MEALRRKDLPETPVELFTRWYARAEACESIRYPGAMSLATVGADGFPQTRIVLLEQVDNAGFYFFTDRRSRKGLALADDPRAALNFYWGPLERQVVIQGAVKPAPEGLADAFFRRRPRKSQVTAWASQQSQPVASKRALQERLAELDARFRQVQSIPRPPDWQAYCLEPTAVEFWLAQARRLHDRFLYTKTPHGSWKITRLAP